MKIRQGYVSNSSSSSFIILGIKNTSEFCEKIKHIVDYEPEANCDYGEDYINNFIFVHPEYEEYKDIDTEKSQYKLLYASHIGKELNEKELDNKTLLQIKKETVKSIKKEFDLEITENDLILEFGEYDR